MNTKLAWARTMTGPDSAWPHSLDSADRRHAHLTWYMFKSQASGVRLRDIISFSPEDKESLKNKRQVEMRIKSAVRYRLSPETGTHPKAQTQPGLV